MGLYERLDKVHNGRTQHANGLGWVPKAQVTKTTLFPLFFLFKVFINKHRQTQAIFLIIFKYFNDFKTLEELYIWLVHENQKFEIKYASDCKNEFIKCAFLLFRVKGEYFLVFGLVTEQQVHPASRTPSGINIRCAKSIHTHTPLP